NTVPSAMAELLRQEGVPASVVTVNLAGEALPRALADQIYAVPGIERLYNLYGPSEDTTYSTFVQVARISERMPPIGRPLAGTQGYVVDRSGQPMPAGVAGELLLGGGGLARGYLGRPKLTAERFVPDAYGEQPGGRLYRTGDLARFLADGTLEFLGRLDHQVKIRGFRIEPGEIESALLGYEGVREVAVVPQADPRDGQWLVAYVAPHSGVRLAMDELRSWLRRRLPDYMVPGAWVELSALPRSAHGKLDRRALPAPETVAHGADAEPAGFRTITEELLAGIWCEVLRLERVFPEDDFFALGGHSLLATQLVSRVRQAFGVEMAVRVVFEAPTVSALAVAVGRLRLEPGEPPALPLLPVSRTGRLPLSFAQQRLWFLDQLEPGRATYNVPVALRVSGPLDSVVLAAVLTEIARRHEGLRTTFPAVEGEPEQRVHPAGPVPLPIVDLAGLPAPAREAEARRQAGGEADRPFDLVRGPLFRAQLLRLGLEDHVVSVTMHHIVSDGWSMGILTREVAALYEGFAAGLPSPLPELPVQYADYSAWQRARLSGEALERELGFWRQRLDGAPAVLELPLDRPRPAVRSARGGSVPLRLSPELGRSLVELSRRSGATPFMTLLAGLDVLLGRYSGQEDLTVGTPVAGRTRLETEGLIGFFVNTLALRVNLSGAPGFAELLPRVRERALEAHAHQEVPFERLVEDLASERSLSHSPLFQVMFALQNAPRETLELPRLVLQPFSSAQRSAKFDLTLALSEVADQGFAGAFEYDAALFDPATIERLAGHFQRILEEVLAHPERAVPKLSLLSVGERHQLLLEVNAGESAYPSACIHELFAMEAARHPERPALSFRGTSLSYGALESGANRLSHRLRRLGVGPEVPVVVFAERSAAVVMGLLAVLKAGGYFVPLDPKAPAERLALLLEEVRAPVVLTQRNLLALLPG
ncbi:MAG TPA: condensation domain-containing protein, partial [Thermoanaerobaculia bacterium]|nr:condensation domain-containing protein [Thermoanaerobaculia bacterium]